MNNYLQQNNLVKIRQEDGFYNLEADKLAIKYFLAEINGLTVHFKNYNTLPLPVLSGLYSLLVTIKQPVKWLLNKQLLNAIKKGWLLSRPFFVPGFQDWFPDILVNTQNMRLNLMRNTYYDLLNPNRVQMTFLIYSPAWCGAIHIDPPLADLVIPIVF